MECNFRPSTLDDINELYNMIVELAEHQNITHLMQLTKDDFAHHLFSENSFAHVLIMEEGHQIIGFALYFKYFSTFTGPGVYMEDVYIKPEYRRKGHFRQLADYLKRWGKPNGCDHVRGLLHKENKSTYDIYKHLGADIFPDWMIVRKKFDE